MNYDNVILERIYDRLGTLEDKIGKLEARLKCHSEYLTNIFENQSLLVEQLVLLGEADCTLDNSDISG